MRWRGMYADQVNAAHRHWPRWVLDDGREMRPENGVPNNAIGYRSACLCGWQSEAAWPLEDIYDDAARAEWYTFHLPAAAHAVMLQHDLVQSAAGDSR